MSIIGWLLVGLIEGLIASKVFPNEYETIVLDIVLGIAGAIVGGLMFSSFATTGFWTFNVFSMIVAAIGAVVVLTTYHALFSRR